MNHAPDADGADPRRSELEAARIAVAEASRLVQRAPAFSQLPAARQAQILQDLSSIGMSFDEPSDPYAFAMATPRRRNPLLGLSGDGQVEQAPPAPEAAAPAAARPPATEQIAARAGALLDEIDFPSFVAGLLHGTFDAVVDAGIRQLEAFADLVASVAKSADQFTADNVTDNQARDWLVERYPGDLLLSVPADGAPRPVVEPRVTEDGELPSPAWLVEFGLDGEELTPELIEEQLIPQARQRLGQDRLQTLATMVLLGMSRVVVRDGSISAKLRFRAAAQDRAEVDFAIAQDPGGQTWGARASTVYPSHSTMVSTVGVNAQTDAQLKADLFGEVRLNFQTETLPLDQFANAAQRALLQRNARWASDAPRPPAAPVPELSPVPAVPAPATPSVAAPVAAVVAPDAPAAPAAPAAPGATP